MWQYFSYENVLIVHWSWDHFNNNSDFTCSFYIIPCTVVIVHCKMNPVMNPLIGFPLVWLTCKMLWSNLLCYYDTSNLHFSIQSTTIQYLLYFLAIFEPFLIICQCHVLLLSKYPNFWLTPPCLLWNSIQKNQSEVAVTLRAAFCKRELISGPGSQPRKRLSEDSSQWEVLLGGGYKTSLNPMTQHRQVRARWHLTAI